MSTFFNWWYAFSLPVPTLGTAPIEREQERYRRLTAGLLLLLLCAFLPLSPIMLFFSPTSPSARPGALGLLCLLSISWIAGRT